MKQFPEKKEHALDYVLVNNQAAYYLPSDAWIYLRPHCDQSVRDQSEKLIK